ncbi:MAG: hypothetical protein F6K40_15445 [Okeania sp. SIO3I5]|uniref:hypothetical protein n=1 Tax=Okeania sp. SIO3I5 TaxID=2607805 RepID=UPI0013BDDF50|nr:hypothetical protein [Okeania sp. SIO3I5]NEQ37587.1 hypothetical protein [Okeania sp. SIO3I5]
MSNRRRPQLKQEVNSKMSYDAVRPRVADRRKGTRTKRDVLYRFYEAVISEVGLESSHYWGHIQGKVQPTFRKNYERSHASLS